jgi:peptidoglycan/LPS O-acetylase OafA/YrhL
MTLPARAETSNSRRTVTLKFLDGLRGLAALYVVIGHARWLLWEGYSAGFQQHPGLYSGSAKIVVYVLAGFSFGHEAVLFFFVLSGFVIHLRYARQIHADKIGAEFDWSSYVWRRLRRLYPPLLFAMALTIAVDILGARLGYPIYFQNTPYSLINQTVISHHGWSTALGNLAFLMTSYVPVWGVNGPLWSLKFEWWFYMIYPLCWWFSKKSIVLATIVIGGLWLASFAAVLWPVALFRDVFSMMLAWWFGALLADMFVGRIKISFAMLAPFSLLVGIMPFVRIGGVTKDILWSVAFVGVISLCFTLQKRYQGSLALLERLKPLGDMSYTLYVIHFPLLVFISGYLMSRTSEHLLPSGFGWMIVGIVMSLSIAYLAHWVVEVPFVGRKKAARRLTVAIDDRVPSISTLANGSGRMPLEI